MSTRFGNTYYSKPIQYLRSYIPRRIPSNRQNFESVTAEQDEEDLIEVPEDSQDTEEPITQDSYCEDDPETDNSIEEEDQDQIMKEEEESSSELEDRQLSYVSLPSLLLSSDSGNNLAPGDRQKSYSASPSHSFDSVAMDLESDHEEQYSQEPSEDIDDESSQHGEDFVNVRVKVQKGSVYNDSVKVTVSVESPSEIEKAIEDISNESDISESEVGSDSEVSEDLENQEDSESINSDNDNRDGVSESDCISGESNNESEGDEEMEDKDESGIGEESEVTKSDELNTTESENNKIVPSTIQASRIPKVKTESENGKYNHTIELLDQAIIAGQKKIAEDIAQSFIKSLTPTPISTPKQSPLKTLSQEEKVRNTKEALLSPMKLVESNIPIDDTLIRSLVGKVGDQTQVVLTSVQPYSEISKSLPQIPRSQPASLKSQPGVPKSQPVSPKLKAIRKPEPIISVALINQTPSSFSKLEPDNPVSKTKMQDAQPGTSKSQALSSISEPVIPRSPRLAPAVSKSQPGAAKQEPVDSNLQSQISKFQPGTSKSQVASSISEPVIPRSPRLPPAVTKSQPGTVKQEPVDSKLQPDSKSQPGTSKQKPIDAKLQGQISNSQTSTSKSQIASSISQSVILGSQILPPAVLKSQPDTLKQEPVDSKFEPDSKSQPGTLKSQVSSSKSKPVLPRSPSLPPVISKSQPSLPSTSKSSLPDQISKSQSSTSKSQAVSSISDPVISRSPRLSPAIPKVELSKSDPTIQKHPSTKSQSEKVKVEPPKPPTPKVKTPSSSLIDPTHTQKHLPMPSKSKPIITQNLENIPSIVQPNEIKNSKMSCNNAVGFEDETLKPNLQKSLDPSLVSTQSLKEEHNQTPSKGDVKADHAGSNVEDYLSVYADSAETTDEDDDENTLKKQARHQTLEEQEELKAAKDKLVELWKFNIREDISDLDEGFNTILDDMLSELKLGPVQPPMPTDIKTLEVLEEIPQELTKEQEVVDEMEEQSEQEEVEGLEKQPEQNMEAEIEEENPKKTQEEKKPEIEEYEVKVVVEPDSPQSTSSKSSRKWNNSTEIASALSQYLVQIKTETVEDNIAEIIPLLTHLLLGSRKNKSEHDLPTMIATMSAVRVLCDRVIDVRALSGDRGLRNVDLSWLLRVLCKISADPESKVRTEASFSLARLVKAAEPELITRPIYFLLVMENEGFGHKKGAQGAKTKAAALDTLTYAMLTFRKEDFGDLEEIARWVCLVLFHSQRRVRQSALECLAVIGDHLGNPDRAISLFRRLITREKEFELSGSSDDGQGKATGMTAFRTRTGLGIFDVSAVTAFSTRLRKQILPLPSSNGLIEYGVKVPTGKDLIVILTKLQEIEENEFDASSSADSFISVISNNESSVMDPDSENESIRMSDLERSAKAEKETDKVLGDNSNNNKQSYIIEAKQEADVITADVAYILAGKGRVCNQEIVVQEENLKQADELIPKVQQDLLKTENKDKQDKSKKKKKKHKKKREPERNYDVDLGSANENDDHLQASYIGLPLTNGNYLDYAIKVPLIELG